MRTLSFLTICLALLLLAPTAREQNDQSAPTCSLELELIDAQRGEPLPGLIQIRTADGTLIDLPRLINHGHGVERRTALHEWWALAAKTTLEVPQEKLSITAISGLEFAAAERTIDLTGRQTTSVKLPLARFYHARAQGYAAGNTHLHLQKMSKAAADRYLRELPLADGLDIVFISYLERAVADLEYTSNNYTPADLNQLASERLKFGHGEEHRHNMAAYGEGYGHVLLLDIPRIIHPVSIGPGITKTGTDAPPLKQAILQARRDGGRIIWAHNLYGFEDIPNWLAGRVHANNIFDGGTRGSYKDSFYRYLNIGLRVPFSSGTDWFIYDFNRAYVLVDGPLAAKNWLAGLEAGRSYITNGPLLELTVDGRPLGEVIELNGPSTLLVRGSARGRVDFARIELVQNGRVVARAASTAKQGHFAAELITELKIDAPCWLALRTPAPPVANDPTLQEPVPANELGAPLFGHTSPIYVQLAGRGVFDRDTAESLLQEMKANLQSIDEQAVFADDAERDSVRQVYLEGMRKLEELMQQADAE